jgi:hypothetical protein
MLANAKLIQPLNLQFTRSASSAFYADVLDLPLDPVLAQLPLQARIVSFHQLDDAARIFASGRKALQVRFVLVGPTIRFIGIGTASV